MNERQRAMKWGLMLGELEAPMNLRHEFEELKRLSLQRFVTDVAKETES